MLSNRDSSNADTYVSLAVLILLALIHPADKIPQEYCTIRHGYKKEGFKLPSIKEVSEEEEDDEPVAGYKKVNLVPPPINTGVNTGANRDQTEGEDTPGVSFNDPWAHRPSPTADKY